MLRSGLQMIAVSKRRRRETKRQRVVDDDKVCTGCVTAPSPKPHGIDIDAFPCAAVTHREDNAPLPRPVSIAVIE